MTHWNDSPQITPHLDKYPNADLLWCQVSVVPTSGSARCSNILQEEPLNNGAWTYVGPRIYTAGRETQHHKGKYPHYAGRGPTSSVATGSKVCSFHTLLLIWLLITFPIGTSQEGDRSFPKHSLCLIILWLYLIINADTLLEYISHAT